MAEKVILWGRSAEPAIFSRHVKRRHLGPEVNDLHWWVELSFLDKNLNFGQEPEFLEESIFKLFSEKLFSNY